MDEISKMNSNIVLFIILFYIVGRLLDLNFRSLYWKYRGTN